MSHASNEIGIIDVNTNRYTPLNATPGRHPPRVTAPDMVYVGRSLYIFGGQTHTGTHSQEMWRFDIDGTSWVQLSGGLPPLQLSITPSQQSISGAAAEKAAIASAAVAAIVQPLWPEPRAYHRMASSTTDERIFMFGGVRCPPRQAGDISQGRATGSFFNDMWQYTIRTHRWTKLVPASDAVPRKRSSHTMTFALNALWVFGGQNGRGVLMDDMWRFSLDDSKWTKIETRTFEQTALPTPRSF